MVVVGIAVGFRTVVGPDAVVESSVWVAVVVPVVDGTVLVLLSVNCINKYV